MAVKRESAARPEQIRRHNLELVLRHVHSRCRLTRAELVQVTGLNRSTIGALVSELSDRGVVDEFTSPVSSGLAARRAGRPGFVVMPRPRSVCVLAADIDADAVTMAAIGLGGDVLARRSWRLTRASSSPAQVVGRIAVEAASLGKELAGVRQAAIGVSVPAMVRSGDGFVAHAPNLGWRGVSLGEQVGTALGLPVRIGNDADLAALAEIRRGSAVGFDHVVCVLGRVGIGGGLVANGAPLSGYLGYAGEIGHMVLNPEGPLCHCGSRGCLEEYASASAILRRAARAGLPSTDLTTLFDQAAAGRDPARRVLDEVADWLGQAIANLVNLLNPRVVVLDGHLREVLRVAEPRLREVIDRRAVSNDMSPVQLLPGALPDAPLRGAAELAFEDLVNSILG